MAFPPHDLLFSSFFFFFDNLFQPPPIKFWNIPTPADRTIHNNATYYSEVNKARRDCSKRIIFVKRTGHSVQCPNECTNEGCAELIHFVCTIVNRICCLQVGQTASSETRKKLSAKTDICPHNQARSCHGKVLPGWGFSFFLSFSPPITAVA